MLSFEIRQSDRSGQHRHALAQMWVWVCGVTFDATNYEQVVYVCCSTAGDGLHNIKVQAWRLASR